MINPSTMPIRTWTRVMAGSTTARAEVPEMASSRAQTMAAATTEAQGRVGDQVAEKVIAELGG